MVEQIYPFFGHRQGKGKLRMGQGEKGHYVPSMLMIKENNNINSADIFSIYPFKYQFHGKDIFGGETTGRTAICKSLTGKKLKKNHPW